MMLDQGLVGERVRQMRIINGLSATGLAPHLGLSSGAMSLLENGRLPIDVELLERLAGALSCTPAFFQAPDADLAGTRPWLRAYADASKRAVDRLEQDNKLIVQMIEQLELTRIGDTIPLLDGALDDDEAIEEAAAVARTALNLDEGDVIRNAVRAAERLGCVIVPMEDELGRHLGMSQRIDGVPLIRISRPSEDPDRNVPGDRQRFTAMHELAHLALHHDCPPPNTPAESTRYEKQAHRYAAAFLAPADPLLADLNDLGGRVTLNTLAHLKQRWGVAIKALVVRFHHLGMIDEAQARSIYKQISARGWNKAEPVRVPNERGQWLAKAMVSKFGKDGPAAIAAALTGLGRDHFDRWVDWTPTPIMGDLADVVELKPRARTLVEDDAEFGARPVTRLSIRPW